MFFASPPPTFPPRNRYLTKLASHRILIIGGTTSVGFSVAEAALEHGASVVISSFRPSELDQAIARLRVTYPDQAYRLRGITCDVSSPYSTSLERELRALLEFACAPGSGENEGGGAGIDHVVYISEDLFRPVPYATRNSVEDALRARFLAPRILAQLLPAFMPASTMSSYTLTSSQVVHLPPLEDPFMTELSSMLETLTRGLAIDLRPRRVNCVQLGAVRMELLDRFFDELEVPTESRSDIAEQFAQATLAGSLGTSEEVAEAFLYFMKDRFCTGSLLRTDGGASLVSRHNVM
ncbi:MAG: hypothetical protein Q9227_009573 [Pyrenula ochraceoflavens]